MKRISVSVSETVAALINGYAKDQHMTRGEIVTRAMDLYHNEQQERAWEQEQEESREHEQ